MTKIAIVLASTRPGRAGANVARWVAEQAAARTDAEYELVDLAALDLPQIDEPFPPALGRYTHPHTIAWAELVAGFDGFLFVTPEYNHSFPGVLKNALDRVYAEWNDKAAGFVSYGVDGGVRAVEALRPVLGALRMADIGATVTLDLRADFQEFGHTFAPREHQAATLDTVLDHLARWSTLLEGARAKV